MTEEQARKGLDALKERRDEGEYFGFSWTNEIERRLAEGESLSELMGFAVNNAKRWQGVANMADYPTNEQQKTVGRLLEAVA